MTSMFDFVTLRTRFDLEGTVGKIPDKMKISYSFLLIFLWSIQLEM